MNLFIIRAERKERNTEACVTHTIKAASSCSVSIQHYLMFSPGHYFPVINLASKFKWIICGVVLCALASTLLTLCIYGGIY